MSKPTEAAVLAYVNADGGSWTLAEVTTAYKAEAKAQGRVCRVPSADDQWDDDLGQALMRRVRRNLAMRALPLGLSVAAAEGAVAAIRVGYDYEVRRLEAPHRKLVLG